VKNLFVGRRGLCCTTKSVVHITSEIKMNLQSLPVFTAITCKFRTLIFLSKFHINHDRRSSFSVSKSRSRIGKPFLPIFSSKIGRIPRFFRKIVCIVVNISAHYHNSWATMSAFCADLHSMHHIQLRLPSISAANYNIVCPQWPKLTGITRINGKPRAHLLQMNRPRVVQFSLRQLFF